MNDNYTEVVKIIAEKLGSTTQHVWEILLRQAPITCTVNLVIGFILSILAYKYFVFTKHKTTTPPKTEDNHFPTADWADDAAFAARLVCVAVVLFVLLFNLIFIRDAIIAFLNPEYWALKTLLK